MERIKVIIADDKQMYRKLISEMLEPAIASVIGEAADGKKLLRMLRTRHPDIVLLDLDMPVMDGNKAFDLICKNFPNVKVIILSFYSERVLIEHYLKRGAKSYIPKDALDSELLMEVLKEVQNGKVFLHEKLPGKKLFTERQKEIMPFLFDGLTNDRLQKKFILQRGL